MSKMTLKVLFVRYTNGSISAKAVTDAGRHAQHPEIFGGLYEDILDGIDDGTITHAIIDVEVDGDAIEAALTPKVVTVPGKVVEG